MVLKYPRVLWSPSGKGAYCRAGPSSFPQSRDLFLFYRLAGIAFDKGRIATLKKNAGNDCSEQQIKKILKRVKLLRKLYIESYSQDIKITLE